MATDARVEKIGKDLTELCVRSMGMGQRIDALERKPDAFSGRLNVLTAATQRQQKQIDKLEAYVHKLKRQITFLTAPKPPLRRRIGRAIARSWRRFVEATIVKLGAVLLGERQ